MHIVLYPAREELEIGIPLVLSSLKFNKQKRVTEKVIYCALFQVEVLEILTQSLRNSKAINR